MVILLGIVFFIIKLHKPKATTLVFSSFFVDILKLFKTLLLDELLFNLLKEFYFYDIFILYP